MDGMGETRPPTELCWLGGGGENDDGMVLTWGGWRPSGRAPASAQDNPLGGMLVSWLEKTLWPQQQGFGSNPKLLVRTAQGRGAGVGEAPQVFVGDSPHGSTENFCQASSHSAIPKTATEQGGEQAEVVKY